MGRMLKTVMSRAELIAMMQESVDWERLKQSEAQQLHKKIVEAANLVLLTAPGALKQIVLAR